MDEIDGQHNVRPRILREQVVVRRDTRSIAGKSDVVHGELVSEPEQASASDGGDAGYDGGGDVAVIETVISM
jgi:cystathionine beta-lyase/cystathionine gamma-synthase